MSPPRVIAYTDGGCRPNPGPGGWGVVLVDAAGGRRELSGGETDTTNNRMELLAAIRALAALDGPHEVEVVTDSQYLRRGVAEWLPGWRARGWRTASGSDVKNRDLWETLASEIDRHRVTWRWTRGHAGNRWNERADRLAAAAIPGAAAAIPDEEGVVLLYAAAAFSGRSGRGGWGVVMRWGEEERELSGAVDRTSANRMHIEAAIQGLGVLKRRVRVCVLTPSDYLKDGATTWLAGWQRGGWRTRDGREVSHREAWQRLGELLAHHQVEWRVMSAGELPPEAERAKRLAAAAAVG